jgi:uncharacterized protein DUF4231
MDETAIKKYLATDYANALEFYDHRAGTSKRWYRVLSTYLIVVSAGLTPLIAFAPKNDVWRIIASVLSATIVMATGLLAQFKCHENWLSYRSSWDALERERRFYETEAGAYKSVADKGVLFVERVEALLAKEGADFYTRHAKSDDEVKKPDAGGRQ